MKKYSESWKKPKVYYDIEKSEQAEHSDESEHSVIDVIRPKGAQIEALYELKKARADGLFYAKFLLGLTATPERLDNKDILLFVIIMWSMIFV